jgi:hypothetical protein
MEARLFKIEDLDEIIALHKGHSFPVPHFNRMLDIVVIEDKGKIVAWGYTEKLVEAVFVPGKDLPNITKVKSLMSLITKLVQLTADRGIEQTHSFIQDERFAQLLVERFNFGVASGTPLFLNIKPNG